MADEPTNTSRKKLVDALNKIKAPLKPPESAPQQSSESKYKKELKVILAETEGKIKALDSLKDSDTKKEITVFLTEFKDSVQKNIDVIDKKTDAEAEQIALSLRNLQGRVFSKTGEMTGGLEGLQKTQEFARAEETASEAKKAFGDLFFRKLPILAALYLMFYIPIKTKPGLSEILFFVLIGYAFFTSFKLKLILIIVLITFSILGYAVTPFFDTAYSFVRSFFGVEIAGVILGVLIGLIWIAPMTSKLGVKGFFKKLAGAGIGGAAGFFVLSPLVDIIFLIPRGINEIFTCSLLCPLADWILPYLYDFLGATYPPCNVVNIVGCIALIVIALTSFGGWFWKLMVYVAVFVIMPLVSNYIILPIWGWLASMGTVEGPDQAVMQLLTMESLTPTALLTLIGGTIVITWVLSYIRKKADFWHYGYDEVKRSTRTIEQKLSETWHGRVQLKFKGVEDKVEGKIKNIIAKTNK
ncbi:MAG: hypothetical protein PHW96_03060 [Candidatus Nanoarchaeia archaeon]|nr:hypothetical protein [Candidatus Nanoarchaeia archaeon]